MSQPSILFANDDVLTQWITTEVLSRSGYAVSSVCRCEDAIELLQDGSDFDLLLADVEVADALSGSGLLAQWRKTLPGRPVILTSVQAGPLRCLDRHEYFMQRPFAAARLLEMIEFAMEAALLQPVYAGAACGMQHVH